MQLKRLLLAVILLTYYDVFSQVPSNLPTNGLIAHYPFNSNANDASGNQNHGTAQDVTLTTDRFGNPNSAYEFNGKTSRIDINKAFFDVGWNAYTISCWTNSSSLANPDNVNDAQNVINTDPHNGFAINMYNSNNPFSPSWNNKYVVFAGSQPDVRNWDILLDNTQSNTSRTINTWNHLVLVKNGLNYSFYINGVLDKTIVGAISANSYLCKIVIGNLAANIPNEGFLGKLDDYSIWNRALTQTEIGNVYNGVNHKGLVAYYPFNGNPKDSVGNHDGTVVNGATLTTDRFGKQNSAYNFDGNQWIEVPHQDDLNFSTEFTISLWIKPTGKGISSNNEAPTIINKECEYEISRWEEGAIKWATNSAYDVWHDTKIVSPLNEWKHIIMVYGEGKVIFYENGKKIYEYEKTIQQAIFPTTKPLTIGSRPGGTWGEFFCHGGAYDQNFQGAIDEIKLYNYALSEAESKLLYNDVPKIDLSLKSFSQKRTVQKDSTGTISFTVKNEGQVTATGIKVLLKIPYSPPFVIKNSQNCTKGTFDSNMWTIPTLAAGDSCTLNVVYQPAQNGVWYVEAEVFSTDQDDTDSKANNGIDTEDDFTRACISIPIKVTNDTFGMQLILQDSKIDVVQWYKNGIALVGETKSTLQITSVGKYDYNTKTYKCPSQGCCPFILEKTTTPATCCTPLEYILNNKN